MESENTSRRALPGLHARGLTAAAPFAKRHAGGIAVAALAAVLYLWKLDANGYANTYYAAAVKSMSVSWKAFFYGAIDPGSFITVDKPPAALWVQALSVRVFGFNSWAMLAPEALAGVASVVVLYAMVAKRFGTVAGTVAGFALATSPITAAVMRDNNPDALLVLLLVLAGWAGLEATERGSWRWALASAAIVGVAFNVKMLQAYLVVPPLAVVYALAAPVSLRARFVHLAGAFAVLLAVSASWMAVVDSIPAADRPYIGGSENNTVRDLVFGYNGLGRIFGEQRGPGGNAGQPPFAAPGDDGTIPRDDAAAPNQPPGGTLPPVGDDRPLSGGVPPTGGDGATAGGPPAGVVPGDDGARPGGPGGFGGNPGWARLFNTQNGTQIAWLLPLAAVATVAGFAGRGRASRTDPMRASVIFWGAWAVTHFVVFSKAEGIFHTYYTSAMAPALAALAGIAVPMFVAFLRARDWRLVFPVAAMAGSAWVGVDLIGRGNGWNGWLSPVLVAGAAVAVAGGTAVVLGRRWLTTERRISMATLAPALLGIGVLLFAPAMWASTVLDGPGSGGDPAANPSGAGTVNRPGGSGNPTVQSGLVAYLEANRGGAKYLVAASGSQTTAPIIIATGEPVMTMGGFNGGGPAPTLEQAKAMIASGEVRFFLLGGAGPGGGSTTVTGYVQSACTVVSPSQYGGTTTGQGTTRGPGTQGGGTLYDCGALVRGGS